MCHLGTWFSAGLDSVLIVLYSLNDSMILIAQDLRFFEQ